MRHPKIIITILSFSVLGLMLVLPAFLLRYTNRPVKMLEFPMKRIGLPEKPKEAMFYKKLKNKMVNCQLCFRKCIIPGGSRGFCRVRENRNGKLYSLVYAIPCAIQIDTIEKEPQYHMLPNSKIFCLSTASCNFRCRFCQNWQISQSSPEDTTNYYLPPEEVVKLAKKSNCATISFTYAEPTIEYEYMLDVFKLAKKQGLKTLFHSNGAMNPAPLKNLLKYTDAVTIDLKGFSTKKFYRKFSSSELEPVLRTLKIIKNQGIWLEIVNLIIPTVNDDPKNIKTMCNWIKTNLGSDVPLHFSRFYPAYKLTNLPPTPVATLEKARKTAQKVGLNYVTIGNLPGHKANSTYCPNCGKRLIYRFHFTVLENNVIQGKCKFCNYKIPGLWH